MPNYLKNSDLLREILLSKEQDKLTDNAVRYLQRMVKECTKVMRYKEEADKEDCMAFAMLDLISYWNRFDPNKTNNAFAFFTQVIKNGLAKGWKKIHNVKSTQMIRISEVNGIYNI